MNYDAYTAPCPAPLARVGRGGLLESLHRGHLVQARPDGSIVRHLGDPDFPTFLRSAAKPSSLTVLPSSTVASPTRTWISASLSADAANGSAARST